MQALERVGRRYRVAYTSATHVGTHAPVMAGLAVTTSPITWLPEGLRALSDGELPDLPDTAILLLTAPDSHSDLTVTLARHIIDTFKSEMPLVSKAA